ncbi:MAG: AAA family ATPase [Firmicutes bacterium]|nr:AAA family ATPase [Bacillota bacterium]
MGKIVMPKNSAVLSEIHAVLQIYNETNDWMTNDVYVTKLKELIGPDQYSSSYTKKAQITSYFGFTIWEDISNPQSRRKITESGIRFYNAIRNDNYLEIQEEIMNSLEKTNFGRNNYGSPLSNSDIEPPCLFIRAIFDLDYLTYKEFAFILWQIEDVGANYSDVIEQVKQLRHSDSFVLDPVATKYTDAKPIMILIRWGFLKEDSSLAEQSKKIIINEEVLSRFENRLRNLVIYNIDKDISLRPRVNNLSARQLHENEETEEAVAESIVTGAENVIYYGNPGCGKSYKVSTLFSEVNFHVERTTFHPEFSNSDFVGQIIPKLVGDRITYTFVPGVFARILKYSITNPSKKCALIIEEINRGNASAIFGDIFQLLDRDLLGKSIYKVKNPMLEQYIGYSSIEIPSNLWIIATMNTSDQNVFTLDTAFKRRWQMVKIKNEFDLSDPYTVSLANSYVPGTQVKWMTFVKKVNESIVLNNPIGINSEDKQIGIYFISKEILTLAANELNVLKIKLFSEKVLMYFWDDIAKIDSSIWFDDSIRTLDDLLMGFEVYKLDVFKNIDFSV